jgi:hypothetical protein
MSDFPFRGPRTALRAWLREQRIPDTCFEDFTGDALMGLREEEVIHELGAEYKKHATRLIGTLRTARKTAAGKANCHF